ncbi:MAG: hypothetical protein JXJ04_13440, partial [Spirochaetales bacterium]|nr:hypothetical protein [Spirochaetales bacterium]
LHGTVNLPAKSLVLTDNVDEESYISQFNIDSDIIHTIDSNITGYDVLIIAGKNGLTDDEMARITMFANQGGIVFIIPDTSTGVSGFPFSVTFENGRIFKSLITADTHFISGLGNSDFYFRTLKDVTFINIEDGESVLDIPVIVSKRYGPGKFVFCGINPDNFKPVIANARDYISFIDYYTHHKAFRIINQLLKNCGVAFKTESVFYPTSMRQLYMKDFPAYDVNAFHNW